MQPPNVQKAKVTVIPWVIGSLSSGFIAVVFLIKVLENVN